MPQTQDNPPMLNPAVASVTELSGTWWVAHTKSRCEKAFARDLLARKIGYYIPLVKKVTVVAKKKRKFIVPLFPSYVFFCGTPDDRHDALATDRLCQIIEIPQQDDFIRELASIERVVAQKAGVDLYPFAAVGRKCRITAGPFAGIIGVIVARKKLTTVALNISILGQGASIEIDPANLEAIE